MTRSDQTILAFDVGEKRIGVAKAVIPPRISQPLTTLLNDNTLSQTLETLIAQEQPDVLVVGMPRNMQGEKTAQSHAVEAWTEKYLSKFGLSVHWQDESLTSVAAEAHLENTKEQSSRSQADALAASVILTDFIER